MNFYARLFPMSMTLKQQYSNESKKKKKKLWKNIYLTYTKYDYLKKKKKKTRPSRSLDS